MAAHRLLPTLAVVVTFASLMPFTAGSAARMPAEASLARRAALRAGGRESARALLGHRRPPGLTRGSRAPASGARHAPSLDQGGPPQLGAPGPDAVAGVPDGSGGMYQVWWDSRDEIFGAVYVQRFTSTGAVAPGWPTWGVLAADVAPDQFLPLLVSDDAGGVIVVWTDFRNGDLDIYAQRISPAGARLWDAGGVKVCGTAGFQFVNLLVGDGAGGAFVAWDDAGDLTGPDNVPFIQRITSNGASATGWPAGGVALCAAPCTNYLSHLVPDGAGGVIAFRLESGAYWGQRFSGTGSKMWSPPFGLQLSFIYSNLDATTDAAGGTLLVWTGPGGTLYAQRLNGSGGEVWTPGGVPVTSVLSFQYGPAIAPDGSGGALIAWADFRNSQYDIYAQRIDSAGARVAGWPVDGAAVCTASGLQQYQAILGDGAGGAFIFWDDWRSSTELLYGQRLSSSGAASWTADGVLVTGAPFDPYGSLDLTLDGSGGVFASWLDYRAGESSFEWYGQRFDSGGTAQWTVGGLPLFSEFDCQRAPAAAPDGAGGAIVAWQDRRGSNWDLFAKRVDSAGSPIGSTSSVCLSPDAQVAPVAIPDQAGGAIVAWEDYRDPLSPAIYAQRVDGAVAPQWTANGVRVGPGFGPVAMTTDGANGAILAWRTGGVTIQRLDASGSAPWGPGGLTVSNSGYEPQVVSDGAGGAIVVWLEPVGFDSTVVAALRFDATGAAVWGPDPVIACDQVDAKYQLASSPDGTGGVVMAWVDERTGSVFVSAAIVAQRVTSAGAIASGWLAGGVPVCAAADRRLFPGIAPDGAGGGIVTWADRRGTYWRTYGQRLEATGAAPWAANGVALCDAVGDQWPWATLSDGAGGALLTWADARASHWDIYAQRVNISGARLWGANGVAVTTATGQQTHPALAGDGGNGAIVAWQDLRALPYDRIYVQRISAGGSASWTPDGVTSALASLVSAVAVPGRVRLTWATGAADFAATLERREGDLAWAPIADVHADGSGRVVYEDREVAAGRRYGYRLRVIEGGVPNALGEAWITIPTGPEFALEGARPNPAPGAFEVWFGLPEASPARIELFDLGGRRLLVRELEANEPGRHLLRLEEAGALAPGLFWLRLSQGARSATSKVCVMR